MKVFDLFEIDFAVEKDEDEFTNFFYEKNLTPLFTNEHKAPNKIWISWTIARQIINEKGHTPKVLTEFGKYLQRAQDNMMYEEAVFTVIYNTRTIHQLIKKMERYMEHMATFEDKYVHNTWNIVWYKKEIR